MFEKVRDIIVDTLSCELEDVTMEATLAEDLGCRFPGRRRAEHRSGGAAGPVHR